MIFSILREIRLRLARSERIVAALDGTYLESSVVLDDPDPRVRVGWPEEDKAPGTLFLLPEADTIGQETPRTDGDLTLVCYGLLLEDVLLCMEAVKREFEDQAKGCLSPAGPPTLRVVRTHFAGSGATIRETDEKRLWRATGTVEMIWFHQPTT